MRWWNVNYVWQTVKGMASNDQMNLFFSISSEWSFHLSGSESDVFMKSNWKLALIFFFFEDNPSKWGFIFDEYGNHKKKNSFIYFICISGRNGSFLNRFNLYLIFLYNCGFFFSFSSCVFNLSQIKWSNKIKMIGK